MWIARNIFGFGDKRVQSENDLVGSKEWTTPRNDGQTECASPDEENETFLNVRSNSPPDTLTLEGSLYRVNGRDFQCIMSQCVVEIGEDHRGAPSLVLKSAANDSDDEDPPQKKRNAKTGRGDGSATVFLPLHLITDFQQHLSDAFQFLVKHKKDNAEEYGLQLETDSMALRLRRALEPHLSANAAVLICLPCAFAAYDTSAREFTPIAPSANVAIAQRPADLEAFLIVREKSGNVGGTPPSGQVKHGEILFQDVLSPSMNLWTVPNCCQVVFWGPSLKPGDAGERRMFLVELLIGESNEEAIEFFQLLALVLKERVDAVKLTSAQKSAILQSVTEAAASSTIARRDSDFSGIGLGDGGRSIDEFYQEDQEMFDTRDMRNNGDEYGDAAIGWQSGDSDEEGDTTPVYSRDPTSRAPSSALLHKFMEVGSHRTFVCRGNDTSGKIQDDNKQTELRVYKQSENRAEPLADAGVINADKFKYSGKKINPTKGLLHDQESKLLLSSNLGSDDSVYLMDLEREQIVQKWDTEYQPVHNMIPTFKYGQASHDPTFLCHNNRSLFFMDTRLQGSGRTTTIQYATNPQFSTAVSDMSGHILLGSKVGTMRLYDGEKNRDGNLKRAKTQLETLKEPIISVDVTADGSWILGTTRSYLAVFPTRLASSAKTGFETALGKNKPQPRFLRLHAADIQHYGLSDISFTPAKFSSDESSIVSSTGSLAVIWDMSSIVKGKPKYMLKRANNYIKDVNVAEDNSVIVAYPQDVAVFGTGMRRSLA